MRLPALIFFSLTLSACFAPRPCTQALCPTSVNGEYRMKGWDKSVSISSGTPPMPIVSNSEIEITQGRVEFTNRQTRVIAQEGTSFKFELAAPPSKPIPMITVSSGQIEVQRTSTTAVTVPTGQTYFLPVH
jgi:hypothetical protein